MGYIANDTQEVTHGFYAPNQEQIILLQSILQSESHESVSLQEAEEIGIQLVALYECLARDRSVTLGERGNEQLL